MQKSVCTECNLNPFSLDQKIGISDVVSDLFQDATSVVKVDLNFNIFVDIESSTKERFEKLYSNFVKVVEKMEAKVVQYIKVKSYVECLTGITVNP